MAKSNITGYQFGTVGVSDGISMGTFGMSYSVRRPVSPRLVRVVRRFALTFLMWRPGRRSLRICSSSRAT